MIPKAQRNLLIIGGILLALFILYRWYVYGPPVEKRTAPSSQSFPELATQQVTWQQRAAMPTARTEVGVATLNDKIYVVGGLDGVSRTLATVEAYNPSTNTWETLPDLPAGRHHTATVAYEGKLYVIGGHEGISFTPKAEVYIFDLISQTWSAGVALPEGRGAHGATVTGNSIYVVGGVTEAGVSAGLLRFNLITQQWKNLPPMPTAREHVAVSAVGNQLLVAGGRQGSPSTNMATLEIFDVATEQWSVGPAMPTARGGITGAATENLFFVSGGESTTRTFAQVEAYTPSQQRWVSLPSLPSSRHGLGSAVLNNTLYVIGGGQRPSLSVSGINEALSLSQPTATPLSQNDQFGEEDLTTSPVAQSHRSYTLQSDAASKSYQPKQPTTYTFSIVDGQGNTVKDFVTVHEKIMHLIVVRKDLAEFQHVHPGLNKQTGQFTLANLTFPSDGPYRIFPDFTPANAQLGPDGLPLGVTLHEDVNVGNLANDKPQSLTDTQLSKTFQGYQVQLMPSPTPVAAGQSTTCTFAITQNGKPVTNLEKYLGALGHTVVLREGDLEFLHTHALDENIHNQTGKVDFAVTFPSAGKYKVFSQFQHEGRVLTTDFVVSVAKGAETPTETPADHQITGH